MSGTGFSGQPIFIQPMKVRDFLNTCFTFNRKERMGVIVLCGILIMLVSIQHLIPYLDKWFGDPVSEAPMILPITESAQDAGGDQLSNSIYTHREKKEKAHIQADLFNFDPNTLSSRGWQSLGLSEKQALMIVKYRNKGGVFRKKEDLMRLYCIDSAFYQKLEPFIKLPQDTVEQQTARYAFTPKFKRKITKTVEINSADTTVLIALPGIGTKLAGRIVKYRHALGGFYSSDQLAEVYYMDTQTVKNLKPHIITDTMLIRRININTCTADTLARHPYIRWQMAKAIVAYRKQHGPYDKPVDIVNTGLFDSKLYSKIAPYLTTQ